MITNFLLTFLITPVVALIQLLPSGSGLGLNTLATTITGSSYWPALGWANDYFPINTAITCITVIISVLVIMTTIQIGMWLFHQFWGSN